MHTTLRIGGAAAMLIASPILVAAQKPPHLAADLAAWHAPQIWQRDTDGPLVELGATGDFDDRHLFAPCVALEGERYRLWYCGSRGEVADRVLRLGLATSDDGRRFEKFSENPVFALPSGRHSILTPALLRGADGRVLRDDGRLRMWFSSTDFTDGTGRHTLHESTSADGVHWGPASEVQLENVYAPSIVKDRDGYRLWYTDVGQEPWVIRSATSRDGRRWQVVQQPVISLTQSWEKARLFYPYVMKTDDVYLMWYGSYWAAEPNKTAIGFAVSHDGLTWHKHPDNPVLRPDSGRPWESHYVTSHTVLRLADGTWRIWYASRKRPPFTNKYFAIGTARWNGIVPMSSN